MLLKNLLGLVLETDLKEEKCLALFGYLLFGIVSKGW